jgi:dolichol kinase
MLIVCIWLVFLPAQQKLLNIATQKAFITPFAARKISHLTVGLWVLPLAAFVHTWYIAAIPITMILAANVHANSQRANLGRLETRLFPLFGFLLPEILILYFWRHQRTDLVVLAVLAMTVGDTAAAYIGIRFGKHKIPSTGKTLEGAVGNFAVTLVVLAALGHILYAAPFVSFPLAAAAAAILEAVLPGQWDNSLAVVVLLALLRYSL